MFTGELDCSDWCVGAMDGSTDAELRKSCQPLVLPIIGVLGHIARGGETSAGLCMVPREREVVGNRGSLCRRRSLTAELAAVTYTAQGGHQPAAPSDLGRHSGGINWRARVTSTCIVNA